jgi:transglutaminase-like putative cysteine protease
VRLRIAHETRLAFAKPVREHHCELRLAPRQDEAQRRLSCRIEVEPEAALRAHLDCFGNLVHACEWLAPHDGLVARVTSEVETALANPFAYAPLAPDAERAWLERRLRDEPRLLDFVLHRSEAVPELGAELAGLALPACDERRALLENVQDAMRFAGERFRWEPGTTGVHAALADFAAQRAGVCQDFAHLLVALVRSWGFAARYVMGYVDGESVPEETQGREATHAWAEVLIPGAGWRGFDATAGLVAHDGYVAVAVGRDSRDAAPLRGTFQGEGGGSAPRVALRVERARHDEGADQQQECAAQ